MGSSNIFSSSLSGLNAAMYEMNTTQHNIANASTPGYTRQQVVLGTQPAQASGSGFVGQGVSVTTVRRMYDQFLTTQVLQQQSQSSYLNTYLSSMTQVDNLVSNTTSGVSNAMQSVFDAVNGLANTPTSVPARQTVLSSAQTAADSFQSVSQSLSSMSTALNGQISSSVQSINTFAAQIATLNTSITSAMASNNGQPPNDLLDQRDKLVSQLNQQVGATTQLQPDGSMSLFIGSGQALVVGNQAMALQVVQNPNDPSSVSVAYLNNGKTVPIQQSSLQGGNLGSYIAFRTQDLQPAQNALGLVALGFASNINRQNQLGQDMNGKPGAALMSIAPPLVSAGAVNTGTGSVSATIVNVSAMTASDYQLKFDGTNYTLTRLSDNTVTQLTAAQLAAGTVVDGVTVTASSGMAAGDTFLIRPTANAAGSIAMTTTDPAKVAAALPFTGTASIKANMTGEPTTTVASGAISGTAVSGITTTPAVGTFTVDGKTLYTNTIAAGSTGTLMTGANLDSAWAAFQTANPGYTLTGSFAAGTAQITKTDGTAIALAEVNTGGAGGAITPFAAANPGFMGTATLGTISGTVVSGTTTAPAVGTFTVDGKTLYTNTIVAGSTGTLITGASLDSAWPAFAAANPGYMLTGSFASGTAQISKTGGTLATLAEVNTGGTSGTITPFAAASTGTMGATLPSTPNTTAMSGAISGTVVSAGTTTPAVGTFTVDGKTLFTNSIAAGSTGTLITGANLDSAWAAFQTANPGYTLTGTFAGNNAQITKADGTAVTLAEVNSGGAGGAITPFAAGVGFMGTTPGSKVAGIAVTNPNNTNLTSPVTISFTDATHYTVTGAVPAVAGSQIYSPTTGTISYNGWTMQLTGSTSVPGGLAPVAGDVFSVGANSSTATVSNGSYNLSPVSINFTGTGSTYNVVEMTGTPPVPVTLGSGTYTSPGPSTVNYNGWTTQITGTPAAGDTFNVALGSSGTTMLATSPASNTGSGVISGGALSVQPFTIMFNNPPTSYTVAGATPAVAGSVPYVAGQNISYNGWTIQVSGTPTAGDVFNVAPNTTGTGDNRNALLMAGLQNQNLMSNGTTTLLGQFNQMVGAVGSKTSELTTTSAAQTTLVAQTVASQQSVSGVNLDEEAANLLQYQRAYQASAKAMQIANTMFDALLTLR